MNFVLSAATDQVIAFSGAGVTGAAQTSAGGIPCAALFTRVPSAGPNGVLSAAAPQESGATVDAAPSGAASPFFCAQHVATGMFLVPAWAAAGGADATQYFDLVLGGTGGSQPADAVVFATKTYDAFRQGLPPSVLVAFLAPDDVYMKGFCASGAPPWREYECPAACGADTERAPTGCPHSWLSCNPASGYCQDTTLLTPGAGTGAAIVIPAAFCGDTPSALGPTYFPNCAARAMLAVTFVTPDAVTGCLVTAPPQPAPASTAAALVRLAEMCALVLVIVATLAVLTRLYFMWFPGVPSRSGVHTPELTVF